MQSSHEGRENYPNLQKEFPKSQGLKVLGGSGEEDKWEGNACAQLKTGYSYRYRDRFR